MKVGIVDYKMGNLHSVVGACQFVGLNPLVSSDPQDLLEADGLILPGVGAFGEAMHNLRSCGLDKAIKDFVETGKPFLGICLGLQLLFDSSEEFGINEGLGLVAGSVKRFCNKDLDYRAPIPQIGWNSIEVCNNWSKSLLSHNSEDDYFYFVHSYYASIEDTNLITSKTSYANTKYCSSLSKENIFAAQFHPEKSGLIGLKIYQNFANQIK